MGFQASGSTGYLDRVARAKPWTLDDCIAGFVRPDEGRILDRRRNSFRRRLPHSLDPQAPHCGYVFRTIALWFTHYDARQNLESAVERMPSSDGSRKVTGIDWRNFTRRSFRAASGTAFGGQKQRCCIARELLASRVCAVDETARGLDAPLRANYMRPFASGASGVGIQRVVTHDFE